MNGQQSWSKFFRLQGGANMSYVKPVLVLPFRVVVLPAVFAVLAACASKPTVNASASRVVAIPAYYTVKPGDTLSKIAMRYNLDYRELARINSIDSSYVIYTNQSIKLYDPRKGAVKVPARPATTATAPVIKSQSVNTPSTSTSITRSNTSTVSTTNSSASVVKPPVSTSAVPAPTRPPAPVPGPIIPAASAIQWQWPADGPLVQQFDPATNIKGVRIGGKEGDSVRAAADGDVVYASNRLIEYGNLVLVRHVNGYVTAYAHNSKILVGENDKVKAGQKIAEMGSSGATQTMLEFQVRLNGKPVNPLTLLPKK